MDNSNGQQIAPGWKTWVIWAVKLSLSGLLLWVVFRKVPPIAVAGAIRKANLWWLSLSLVLFLAGTTLFEPQRFMSVALLFGKEGQGIKAWTRLFLESRVFIYMLPSSLGQEGYLWWSLRREFWTHRQCLVWMGFLRATGMAFWLGALSKALQDPTFYQATRGLLLGPLGSSVTWAVLGGAILVLASLVPMYSGHRISGGFQKKIEIWLWVTFSTVGTALTCALSLCAASRAFGASITLGQAAGFQTLLFIAMVLPLSIAALGVQEALLVLLAPGIGFSVSAALGISVALHAQRILPAGIGLLFLLLRRWGAKEAMPPLANKSVEIID